MEQVRSVACSVPLVHRGARNAAEPEWVPPPAVLLPFTELLLAVDELQVP